MSVPFSNIVSLVVFVPESHLESVKQALFNVGAGRWQGYDQCCWQIKGEGQFRPLGGSHPIVGEQDVLEKVTEFRVEMICEQSLVRAAIASLLKAHPYDVPAYYVLPTIDSLSETSS